MQVHLVQFSTGDYDENKNDYIIKVFDSIEKAENYTDKMNQILLDNKLHFSNFEYNQDEMIKFSNTYSVELSNGGASFSIYNAMEVE